MLSLLPLDGGHIAFSTIEGVRRRAVAREVYERVSAIGIALVLVLFFVGLSNDVGRIGGGELRSADRPTRIAAMAGERQIRVGDVAIGGGAPVVVQSMTLTKTHDVE